MTKVYAWPPVKASGAYFSSDYPVSKSRGMQGGDVVSAAWRARRVAALSVSGIHNGGGGYIEALKRLLRGGVGLVRLTTLPAHWHLGWQAPRGQFEVTWEKDGNPVAWEKDGNPVTWISGTPLMGVPSIPAQTPFPLINITGCTPGTVLAYPDEVVQIGGVVTRSLTMAVVAADGTARLRVTDPVVVAGPVTIGVRETGVYRVESDISSFQKVGQGFSYDLAFREVFEDETDGFEEVDPWL